MEIFKFTPFIALLLCIACGSGGNSNTTEKADDGEALIGNDVGSNNGGSNNDGSNNGSSNNDGSNNGGSNNGGSNEDDSTNDDVSNDDTSNSSPSAGERELVVSEKTTIVTVSQCFCINLYRSTLKFYHFEENNAVLLIEFDNLTRDFNRTVNLMLFADNPASDITTNELIRRWINNQHSDGNYEEAAVPLITYDLAPDSVSITSEAFVERLSGEYGDEYEKIRIDFSVSNMSEPGSYFLNGFADQSVVYFQTQDINI